MACRQRLYEADCGRGQENEEKQRQRDAENDGCAYNELLRLLSRKMLFNPLVELVRFALLLERNKGGRIGQRLHALDERGKEDRAAADQRPAEYGIAILDEPELLCFFDKSVGRAADYSLLFRAAHHDALNERLTAY